MRRRLHDNSLSIFFLVLCLVTLVGQAIAGQKAFNEEQTAHGGQTVSLGRYVLSSNFGEAVAENWQSEFLQFSFFILATVWLVQRGSNESKRVDQVGRESDQKQMIGGFAADRSPFWARARGWRAALYSNSLILAMASIFFASWATQSVTGWTDFNAVQRDHDQPTVSWAGYLMRPDFWEKTFQNWQSEFLAVGTMAVFTIYLRQRGSPESKPVGAPHDETGTSG
jgi:uncharacterized membrane protein YhaH (DUF805 family)